jgi:hypothetical protein
MAKELTKELGTYPVKVRTVRVNQEDDGAISIGIRVEFADGEKWDKYFNDRTDKNVEFMHKALKTIGFDPKKNDIEFLVGNPEALWDQECEAVVGEYQGKRRIDWLNPIRKVPPTEALSGLSAKLRAMGKDEPAEGGSL